MQFAWTSDKMYLSDIHVPSDYIQPDIIKRSTMEKKYSQERKVSHFALHHVNVMCNNNLI